MQESKTKERNTVDCMIQRTRLRCLMTIAVDAMNLELDVAESFLATMRLVNYDVRPISLK